MTQRITLQLDDEIAEKLLTLAGSTRRQSEFVANLIVAADRFAAQPQPDGDALQAVNFQLLGIGAAIQMHEARLLSVERQTSALMAGSAR